MRCKFPNILGLMTAGVLLLGVPAWSGPALAQGAAMMGGVGDSEAVTVRAKVKAVDMKTRDVTLVKPNGEVFTIHAGEGVRNLAQVKPGQTVVAHYYTSVAYVLSKADAKTPANGEILATARSEKGQLPGGIVVEKTVVTGTVVAVDMTAHTLQLVNPAGGRIVTLAVKDPQRQKDMAAVAVGDKLTIVMTDALAIGIEPTK